MSIFSLSTIHLMQIHPVRSFWRKFRCAIIFLYGTVNSDQESTHLMAVTSVEMYRVDG